MRTLLVTLALSDAARWPELAEVAGGLGADVAVLQGEGPALVNQLDELAGLGSEPVHLVGVTFGDDLGPTSWLGRVARWWLDSRGPLLELWCSRRTLRGLPGELPCPGEARCLGPRDSLTNPNWEQPPPVSRQVLVCRGPRCNAKGAPETPGAGGDRGAGRIGAADRGGVLLPVQPGSCRRGATRHGVAGARHPGRRPGAGEGPNTGVAVSAKLSDPRKP